MSSSLLSPSVHIHVSLMHVTNLDFSSEFFVPSHLAFLWTMGRSGILHPPLWSCWNPTASTTDVIIIIINTISHSSVIIIVSINTIVAVDLCLSPSFLLYIRHHSYCPF